jgi:hypothetical protein
MSTLHVLWGLCDLDVGEAVGNGLAVLVLGMLLQTGEEILVRMMEKQRRSVGILVHIRRGLCGLEEGRFADLALNITSLLVLFGHVS